MTTEPKAEGVEAVATYGMRRKGATEIIGIVPSKVHAFPARRKEYLAEFEEVPLYTHPTTPAVEALARAALELGDANFAEYCGEGTESMEPDDSKVSYPEERCSITFGMIRRLRAALAHPEIAALC